MIAEFQSSYTLRVDGSGSEFIKGKTRRGCWNAARCWACLSKTQFCCSGWASESVFRGPPSFWYVWMHMTVWGWTRKCVLFLSDHPGPNELPMKGLTKGVKWSTVFFKRLTWGNRVMHLFIETVKGIVSGASCPKYTMQPCTSHFKALCLSGLTSQTGHITGQLRGSRSTTNIAEHAVNM